MVDYHWSPANQRAFLEKLAECGNISEAAHSVSMSAQAAYGFAARVAGRVFALGWDAAILVARRRIEGELMQRALEGQEELYERDPDTGIVKRTRIHNGVTMAMLKRLDQMAAGKADSPADAAMARIVAQDFEHFLDLVEAGGSGAEAMLFLKVRDGGLFPMAHIPQAVEALEFAKQHQLSQNSVVSQEMEPESELAEISPEEAAANMSIWYCDRADGWRTNFPPPEDFIGEEEGIFGEPDYERELDEEEEEQHLAQIKLETAPLRAAGEAARLAWLGIDEPQEDDAGDDNIEYKSMEGAPGSDLVSNLPTRLFRRPARDAGLGCFARPLEKSLTPHHVRGDDGVELPVVKIPKVDAASQAAYLPSQARPGREAHFTNNAPPNLSLYNR
jgi:hypothetical protein